MDLTDELRQRVAERKAARKAELEALQERELLELPDVALLVAEFLSVLIGLMFGVAGKPEACGAMMLIAIYLKIRR